MATNFRVKIGDIGLFLYSEMEWNIEIPISKVSSAMTWLYRVKIG